MSFSIVSYNVLAACHILPDRYPESPPDTLASRLRYGRIGDQIFLMDADLVCLQEVDAECFALLSQRLGSFGYEGFHDLRSHSTREGCGFFAKSGALSLHGRSRCDLEDPPGTADASHRFAQVLDLEVAGHRFLIANTHLQWDRPDRPASVHRGVGQARQLVEAIDRMVGEEGDAIVCGDFNARPDSDVCRVFFEAGYLAARPVGAEQPTCRANGRLSEVDYVLCRGFPSALPWSRIRLHATSPMPGPDHPSDHIPVGATLDAD